MILLPTLQRFYTFTSQWNLGLKSKKVGLAVLSYLGGFFKHPNDVLNLADNEEYKKRFAILYSHLLGTSATFYSWKGLQKKEYEPLYGRAKYFWGSILIALQNEWVISIAKCFEKSSYSRRNEVISVHALLKHYLRGHTDSSKADKVKALLTKHKKVISNIYQLRHKLAHIDAKYFDNPSEFLKKYPVNYGEVEDLLADFASLLSSLNPESGHGYSLDNFVKTPEWEAGHAMDEINFYIQEEKKHLDKFSAGETNDPFLLPRKTP